jgi:hypothetical protein
MKSITRCAALLAAGALIIAGCTDADEQDPDSEPEPAAVDEPEPKPEPEPEPEPEPAELSGLLLEAETLGSGWSSEAAAADPVRIAFANVCGIPNLVLTQADEVEAARYGKDVVAVHLVYRVDDSAKVAEEIAATIERCEPEDEDDNTRVVPVSFAGQGVPPTDAYRITKSLEVFDETIEFESAWSVTQIDATTLSLLGMNANNDSGAVPDPFPMMEEALVSMYGR